MANIVTHFAVLLQVGVRCFVLERREGGVAASSIPPSEVKDRAMRSKARVTSSLELISSFVRNEADVKFSLATNNCRNFAHNFYSEFCDSTASFFHGDGGLLGDLVTDKNDDDVESFCRWVEPMARKDGF